MSNVDKGLVSLNREATAQERGLVRWLLEHYADDGFDHGNFDVVVLLSQIDSLRVVSSCNCGCPTVYFALKEDRESRKGERNISDFLAKAEGQDVGILLFELDGELSSLEVYSCAGHDKPFGLPEIETIHPYGGSS